MSRRKTALRRKLVSQEKWKTVHTKDGPRPQATGERDVLLFLPDNISPRKRALWIQWSKS